MITLRIYVFHSFRTGATGNSLSPYKSTKITLKQVIQLAEKYYDRLEAAAFLDLLPKTVTVANLTRYLQLVLEHENTKKRNLQVCCVCACSVCHTEFHMT